MSIKQNEKNKIATEIYNDGIKPSVQESGKMIALLPRTINAALSPLRKWIAHKEYNVAETEKLLAKKLEHIDNEKIITPEPHIAIPAIQAISYSINSIELRNLYANLLANAMNYDTKDFVHPSFVEIIKQLSPIDAKIFCEIMKKQKRPLINIETQYISSYDYNMDTKKYLPFAEYCSWITEYSLNQCRLSFNNLCRLGLIEIPHTGSYSDIKEYQAVKNNPLFDEALKECYAQLDDNQRVIFTNRYIKTNEISELFYKICVQGV